MLEKINLEGRKENSGGTIYFKLKKEKLEKENCAVIMVEKVLTIVR